MGAAVLAAGLLVAASPPAFADSANAAPAKEAYERGSSAYRKGDYALAAQEYARADELRPNDTALQAALEAAVLSDEVELGMELLERARRGEPGNSLAKAIKVARGKFKGRAGRIRVSCGQLECKASIDGISIEPHATRWVKVGSRRVVIDLGQVRDEQVVEIKADELTEVSPGAMPSKPPAVEPQTASAPAPAPAPLPEPAAPTGPAPAVHLPEAPPPATAQRRGGLSPTWFWVGAAVTGGLGAVTGYYALKASNQHAEFRDQNCPNAYSQECLDLADTGKTYDGNAEFLATATVVAGLGTAVIGIWFVRWSDSPKTGAPGQAMFGVSPGRTHFRLTF